MSGGPVSPVPREVRPYQGMRAGVVSRLAADVLDGLVVTVTVAAGYGTVAALRFMWDPRTFSFPSASWLLLLTAGLVVSVTYLTVAWTITGRSYGKAVMGLRVLGPFGRLRLPGAFLRALACTLFPIGLLWCAVSPANRSLQDVVLRTSVVYDWTPRATPAGRGPRGS